MHFSQWITWLGRKLEGPVARQCYRRHACITISASSRRAIRDRLGWEIPTYVVPVGKTVGTQAPSTAGRACAVGSGTGPRLAWVGRLVAHKRAGLVLDIAERLRASGAVIDVVGHGAERASLAAEVSVRGLAGVVRLRGFLPEADKEALVAQAVLHVSTSHGEGFGLCVLEAAAFGVPTVAFDVDGLRDAVRDGQTGWLVKDTERIEDVVERAIKEMADPVRGAEISDACRAWAAEFDWDHGAQRLALLVDGAIRIGSAQGSRDGAWVVGYKDGDIDRSVVLEGPALDLLVKRLRGTVRVRPAAPAEHLLGRTDGAGWR
jgi:glycosyltransferase involved in cell wall biosynthesis